MTVYLADGRVEIDNKVVENAIRPTAIGKKKWLFVGDAPAGERSRSFTPSSKAVGDVGLTHTLI